MAGEIVERLLSIARRVDEAEREVLEATELTAAQYRILWHLHQHGVCSQTRIAEALELHCSTLSRGLGILQRRKMLRVEYCGDDRRCKNVELTEAGSVAACHARASIAKLHSGAEVALKTERRRVSQALIVFENVIVRVCSAKFTERNDACSGQGTRQTNSL